jgi:hypothetical protein
LRPLAARAFRLLRGGRARGEIGNEVADMHHADRFIQRLAIDNEPRMAGLGEGLQQLADRRRLLDRDHFGTRDHHVGNPPFAKREHVLQHGLFGRREFGRRLR